jgi:hypothetical protein
MRRRRKILPAYPFAHLLLVKGFTIARPSLSERYLLQEIKKLEY